MTAVAVHPTTQAVDDWTPPCAREPEWFFHQDGDRHHDWWWRAHAICHHCPIRRACIETELARDVRPVPGSVWGGWVFHTTGGRPRAHPDDRDLYERHYPRETP